MDIETILSDGALCSYFEQFVNSEFSQENLSFYKCVKGFKSGKTTMQLQDVIDIYEKYIAASSPTQVNLSHPVYNKICQDMEKLKATNGTATVKLNEEEEKNLIAHIFDTALLEITQLLSFDTLHRFALSNLYLRHINGYNREENDDNISTSSKDTATNSGDEASSSNNKKGRRGSIKLLFSSRRSSKDYTNTPNTPATA